MQLTPFKKSICEYNWSICYLNLPIDSRIHIFPQNFFNAIISFFFRFNSNSHLNEIHSHKVKSMKACTTPCKWHPSKDSSHCIHFKKILPKDFCDTTEDSQVLWVTKITDLIYALNLFSVFLCMFYSLEQRSIKQMYKNKWNHWSLLFTVTAWAS